MYIHIRMYYAHVYYGSLSMYVNGLLILMIIIAVYIQSLAITQEMLFLSKMISQY